jgi:hypothetical protein
VTTQRALTVAEYIAITDLYAAAGGYLIASVGDEDTATSAIGKAAAVRDYITAFADPDEADITADLINPVIAVVTALGRSSTFSTFFAQFNSAVIAHLGSDVNAWLTADGTRVHPDFKNACNPAILAVNVFPPVTVVGTYAVTGSGAGTLTDGVAVDTTLYGGAQLELEVTDQQLGVAAITATVVGTTAAGAALTKTGTITGEAAKGAKFDVGSAGDRFADITAVTITGGTNGDKFKIQTKLDR